MKNNIAKSLTPGSIKEIKKTNIFFSILMSLLSMFFLAIFQNPLKQILGMALKSGVYVFTISFTFLYILRYCATKFPDNIFKFRLVRYITSFSFAFLLQLIIFPFFAYISEIPFSKYHTQLLLVFLSEALIVGVLLLMLHDFAILRHLKVQTELENSRLQLRTAQAENLLLKQQIHPHFLFNSLNTLKALIKKDPALSENYLLHLADFLRSAVSQNNSMATTLEEELRFCENYMEMQQIRFGEALGWDLQIEDLSMLQGFVPSFSLQPLLENAIKHNIFTKENPLQIIVRQQNNDISVSNTINIRSAGGLSIKSGLVSLAERYQLWSGEEIIINNDGVTFSVSFKIMMHESSNN